MDHIGEAAANWIYQATKFVSDLKGDKVTSKQVEVSRCSQFRSRFNSRLSIN